MIRGGGDPNTAMALKPCPEWAPPPRSLTAEANSCFMVRVPHGPNRIQGCGASIAPERGLPSDQLYRTSNNEGHRVAVTLDTKVLIQGCVKSRALAKCREHHSSKLHFRMHGEHAAPAPDDS